jgi:ubiquinone/menaquinone biosynthesis C-methylase UbiE
MTEPFDDKHIGEHDWHSQAYCDQWINRDVTRDADRRPVLRRMLELAPFARDAAIKVLDVGAGYGVLSEEVLKLFPRARVTLQDYSEPMAEYARKRFAAQGMTASYIMSDLADPSWHTRIGGGFELAVSALAVHNLEREPLIKGCYGSIRRVLRPGGLFLDYDLFGLVPGGVAQHMQWLVEAGFEQPRCIWEQLPIAIISAQAPPIAAPSVSSR